MTQMTEEMVEAAAAEIYDDYREELKWRDVSAFVRNQYLLIARRALTAALAVAPPHHLLGTHLNAITMRGR